MKVIDANALIVLILGLMDSKLINTHKRTSIYDEYDFEVLSKVIGKVDDLVILPNVWTEVDNLLNNFRGDRKVLYVDRFKKLVQKTTEQYIASLSLTDRPVFYDLGLTDSLILQLAKNSKLLITPDSKLADYATASGIKVFDLKKFKNDRLRA